MSQWIVVALSLQTCFAFSQSQLTILTDRFSEPRFSIRCSQLEAVMESANRSCGSQFPVVSIESVRLIFSGTILELCNHSKYEMNLELNKMLNYLDNTCPMNPDANNDPYRMYQAVQQCYDSYNRHCGPATELPPITALAALIIVKCIPQRATPRPTADAPASPTSAGDQRTTTPTTTTMRTTASTRISTARTSPAIAATSNVTEPVTTTTTTTQKTAVTSTTLEAIVTSFESTTVDKISERSTCTPGADREQSNVKWSVGHLIAIAVGCAWFLIFILTAMTLLTIAVHRRRQLRSKKSSPQLLTAENDGVHTSVLATDYCLPHYEPTVSNYAVLTTEEPMYNTLQPVKATETYLALKLCDDTLH